MYTMFVFETNNEFQVVFSVHTSRHFLRYIMEKSLCILSMKGKGKGKFVPVL